MNPRLGFQVVPILLFVFMVSVNTQMTIQNAPPPNGTTLFTVKDSVNDNRLVAARRLENLELQPLTQNNMTKTLFTLNSFNRGTSGNKDVYTLKLNGSWIHVKNSPNSLSCSLILQQTDNVVGLLRFDIDKKEFKYLGGLPIARFTNAFVNHTFILKLQQTLFIGEECRVAGFSDADTQTYTTYRANANWTNIQIIAAIPLNLLQAKSNDMNYGIYNGSLFRYNQNASAYENVTTFPKYEKYTLVSHGKRILVTGRVSRIFDNTTNPVTEKANYTIYVLSDVGSITVVGKIQIIDAIEQGYQLNVQTSPKLTKLGFGYQTQNSLRIVAKHIDFTSNTVVDLTYEDPVQFAQTVTGMDAQREMDFSDAFIVVRNGSKYDPNANATYFEEAYQFVGSKVIKINYRNLTTDKEFYSFKKTRIDLGISDKLLVLNVYNISAGNYSIEQFNYGNIASNRQIMIPPTPAYASFVQTAFDSFYSTPDILQWGYSKTTTNNTEIKVVWVDNSTNSRTSTTSYTNDGTFSIKYQSPKCQIIVSNQQLLIYKFNETSKTFVKDGEASSTINPLTINPDTVLSASLECDRIRLNRSIFYKLSSSTYKNVSYSSQLFPVEFNQNLTLSVSSLGQLWKYDHSNQTFTLAIKIPNGLDLPQTKLIYSKQHRILLTAKNSTLFQALAFNLKPDGSFSTCLNYSFSGNGNAGTVYLSPNLSKFLLLTPNSTGFTADLYFIDYQNNTSKYIDFPRVAVFKANKTNLFLDDRFMYIRQLEQTGVTADFKESVFFFAQNIVVKPVFTNIYPRDTNSATWVRSIISTSPQNNNTYLFTELVNKAANPYTRLVKVREINAQAAELNSNNNALCQSEIVDGKVKLCPRGCTNCECTSCISGFVYDSSSKSCFACAPGCIECDSTVLTKCTYCYPGYFKNSTNNCQPCQAPCLTCSVSATSCSKCPPGQYYSTGLTQCDNCPRNCFNCTNDSACSTCQPGFVLNPNNNVCRKCSIKCSSCNPSDITKCTSCAKGLQLLNGDCVPCSANCLSCSSGQCAECSTGYHVNSNGSCVLDCKIPCVTCAQNQPTVCLSCQTGSILSNSTCQIDSSCNTNHSCTDCGQGLNFYLMPSGSGADCLACPSLPNCLQCSSGNTYKCSMCANGYYLNQTSDCFACSSICSGCVSSLACTGCMAGYTLLDGYSQGQCLKCQLPCQACQGSTTYCTSCVSGFTKKNWMCQNNTYISLKFVVNTDSTNFLTKIDEVINGLLQILNQTNINVITLNSIQSGSIVPTLSISPTSASLSAASSALSSGLVGGIPGTSFTVSGVQVVQNGVETVSEEKSTRNLGLIIGLTVGLVALGTFFLYIVVVIIVVVVLVKRRMAAAAQSMTVHSFNAGQSRQEFSLVGQGNQGTELKETIDVDLHFAKHG